MFLFYDKMSYETKYPNAPLHARVASTLNLDCAVYHNTSMASKHHSVTNGSGFCKESHHFRCKIVHIKQWLILCPSTPQS